MTARLLAIDPGIHALGLACFVDGVLEWARYVEVDMFERPDEFVRELGDLCRDDLDIPADVLVLERPVVYPMTVRRVDPKWLMMLSEVIGACAVLVMADETVRVTPAVWKGRESKTDTEARAREALAAFEIERVELPRQKSLRHNVWDAVALALWRLRRTAPCYQGDVNA